VILAAAILIGAYIRVTNLATLDLSADEGASWAAASAPSLLEVLRRQARLNPGELGLHDLALHLWMAEMGDSLIAMRMLSACVGTIAIVLVFFVGREILALTPSHPISSEPTDSPGSPTDDDEPIAAIAALLFAVNLVTIKYAREARMYPLALALTLAQVWCFLRALRSGKFLDQAAAAILTALAIAATFSTALVLLPEGLYLCLNPFPSLAEAPRKFSRVVRGGAPLLCGAILTVPCLMIYLHLRGGAPAPAVWDWIQRPSLGAPVALFNKATGTYLFPLLAILAATGVARGWSVQRDALIFLLLWTFAPPIFLTAVSYAIRPAFVERYLLSCFVPFFALSAIGVLQLQPAAFRPGALALVVVLALAHVAEWERKPHGEAWDEAATKAAAGLTSSDAIGVAPRYAGNVIRYYLRDAPAAPSVEAVEAQPPPVVVIVADTVAPDEAAALALRYPRLLAHPRGLVVRAH
jgi:hypothetical protein